MFSQASVSHSIHNRPHGHSVTAHPCWLLRRGRYASYWNAFLFILQSAATAEVGARERSDQLGRNYGRRGAAPGGETAGGAVHSAPGTISFILGGKVEPGRGTTRHDSWRRSGAVRSTTGTVSFTLRVGERGGGLWALLEEKRREEQIAQLQVQLIKVHSHQAKVGAKAKEIKRHGREDQRINGKQQKKIFASVFALCELSSKSIYTERMQK